MYDFGSLVYLDMQKTGSTLTARFLKRCCILKPQTGQKHGAIRGDYNKDALYFTTIRDPFATYLSLFRFGCGKQGALYRRVKEMGKDDLYEADSEHFNKWLSFMTTAEGITAAHKNAEHAANIGLGIMSIRHLRCSLESPGKKIKECKDFAAAMTLLDDHAITDLVIKSENLTEGLKMLATEKVPQFFDAEATNRFFLNTKNESVNASKIGDPGDFTISPENREVIKIKEMIIIKKYYPELM